MMDVGLDRRTYRRLLEPAESCAGGSAPAVVPFTQTQLAELTGGTRPSVDQALQRLVADGTVSLGRGRIEVHDLAPTASAWWRRPLDPPAQQRPP